MERVEMQGTDNDTPPSRPLGVGWRKSSHSNPCGSCVELAQLAAGRIAVRDSRHPDGPALIHPRAELAAFIHGVTAGEFDGMT